MPNQTPTLKKALTPVHLWAIGVGLVISGEYFGWNYGWGVAGTVGLLIATLFSNRICAAVDHRFYPGLSTP